MVVTINEKNAARAPTIIAPITLVAAKLMTSRMTAAKMVPKMPVKRTDRIEHMQPLLLPAPAIKGEAIKVSARKATAMENATIEKTGLSVMTAVI